MIDFINVSKTYPNGTHALYGITLSIDKGEFVFIVGASGAGKSTFLKLIMHEETPTSGKIVINDTDITKLRRRKAMRAVGKPSSVIKKRVPYVLELVGLKDKMKNRPSELSGGEQQRVSLARALVNNPEIIIADEPTGNVDPEMSHEIIELLNEINATGTTVIVVTHEHDLVREFDRRVVVLDHGKIKSDTKDLFVKDDYADDYGDDSGEEENTPDYPDNAVVVPE